MDARKLIRPMAIVGEHNFPDEHRDDGHFLARGPRFLDEPGAYVDAADGSALWYFLDSDEAEEHPVGLLLLDPDFRPETPVDLMVQTPTGEPVRLRDSLALASAVAT